MKYPLLQNPQVLFDEDTYSPETQLVQFVDELLQVAQFGSQA